MTVSIPALIAEARKAQVAVYLAAPEPVAEDLHRIIMGLADALESLSAPSGDDGLPERLEAQATFVPETRMADVMREAATALRAARRPSPVTREARSEAREALAEYEESGWVSPGNLSVDPARLAEALRALVSLPESAENPVVSAIEAAKAEVAAGRRASVAVDVPDPVTRAALATVADAIRRNCTPDWDAYQRGGDVLIAAVADWVENPPEWVASLRSLPEPAEEAATQYRAVWPGGSVSMPLPSRVPLDELFESGESPRPVGIEKRTARYGAWVPVKGAK